MPLATGLTNTHSLTLSSGTEPEGPLAAIAGLLQQAQALVIVTGPARSGKTVLLQRLDDILKNSHRVFRLMPPRDERDIYLQIAEQLHLDLSHHKHAELVALVGKHLADCRDKPIALLCDDAHEYPLNSLEQLRQLTNINASDIRGISLVLCGTQSLRKKLRSSSLRPLQQRVSAQFTLSGTLPRGPYPYFHARYAIWLSPLLLLTFLFATPVYRRDALQDNTITSEHQNVLGQSRKIAGTPEKKDAAPKHWTQSAENPPKLDHIFTSEEEALAAIQGRTP